MAPWPAAGAGQRSPLTWPPRTRPGPRRGGQGRCQNLLADEPEHRAVVLRNCPTNNGCGLRTTAGQDRRLHKARLRLLDEAARRTGNSGHQVWGGRNNAGLLPPCYRGCDGRCTMMYERVLKTESLATPVPRRHLYDTREITPRHTSIAAHRQWGPARSSSPLTLRRKDHSCQTTRTGPRAISSSDR